MLNESLLHLMRQVLPFLNERRWAGLIALPKLVINDRWQHFLELGKPARARQLGNGRGELPSGSVLIRHPEQKFAQPIDLDCHSPHFIQGIQGMVASPSRSFGHISQCRSRCPQISTK